MKQFIAERKLLYSLKGGEVKGEFTIGISAPYSVQEGMVSFPVGDEGCSGCHVGVIGLNEKYSEVYGADSLQAINLASNAVEAFLRILSKKYNIYHLDGERYFDDAVT